EPLSDGAKRRTAIPTGSGRRQGRDPVGLHGGVPSLDLSRGKRLRLNGFAQRSIGRVAQDRLPSSRELLQPLAQIDAVTHQRILESLIRSYQRRRDLPGGQSDAELEGGKAFARPSGVDIA